MEHVAASPIGAPTARHFVTVPLSFPHLVIVFTHPKECIVHRTIAVTQWLAAASTADQVCAAAAAAPGHHLHTRINCESTPRWRKHGKCCLFICNNNCCREECWAKLSFCVYLAAMQQVIAAQQSSAILLTPCGMSVGTAKGLDQRPFVSRYRTHRHHLNIELHVEPC